MERPISLNGTLVCLNTDAKLGVFLLVLSWLQLRYAFHKIHVFQHCFYYALCLWNLFFHIPLVTAVLSNFEIIILDRIDLELIAFL